jgi:hypothetical protein
MKIRTDRFTRGLIAASILAAGLFLGAPALPAAQTPGVLSPNAQAYGKSYAEWSAAWWQWALAQPVTGHPFIDDPAFNVAAGQSGNVWFLGCPFGTVQRSVTIPPGKALFVALLNIESSNLEEPPFFGATAADQQAIAQTFADFIIDVSCSIDGRSVSDISQYRVQSPQYVFTAPTPWIFGATGGTGTSVADGYYVMLAPLSAGTHTLHFSGAFKFSDAPGDTLPLDMTYVITVH